MGSVPKAERLLENLFHYQKDTLEYVKAEWEFNPETNKLYPFEFQNARWFWTRTGRYGVEQMNS